MIKYMSQQIGVRSLIETIEDMGYGAALAANKGGADAEARLRKQREIFEWLVWTCVTYHYGLRVARTAVYLALHRLETPFCDLT